MDTSPFNKLAAELRNHIYELALTQDSTIVISTDSTDSLRLKNPVPSNNILALTQTCKQIRQESMSFFYEANSFCTELCSVSLDNLRLEKFGSYSTNGRSIPENKADSMSRLRRTGSVPSLWKWLRQIGRANARNIHSLRIALGGWVPRHASELERACTVPKMLGAVVELYKDFQPKGGVLVILDAVKFDNEAQMDLDNYEVDILDQKEAGITIYNVTNEHLWVARRKYDGGAISDSEYRHYYNTIAHHRQKLTHLINMTYAHARTEKI